MNEWKPIFKEWTFVYHGFGIYSLSKDNFKIFLNVDAKEIMVPDYEPLKYLEDLPKKRFKTLKYHVSKFSTPDLPLCSACKERPIRDYRDTCKPCFEVEYQELLDGINSNK